MGRLNSQKFLYRHKWTIIGLFFVGSVVGAQGLLDKLRVDNLLLDGNTISSTDTDGDIELTPDGAGGVNIDSEVGINKDAGTNALTVRQTANSTDGGFHLYDNQDNDYWKHSAFDNGFYALTKNGLTTYSMGITNTGNVAFGSLNAGSNTVLISKPTDQVQLSVKGHSTQTNNLLELQNSGSTVVGSVDNSGNATFVGGTFSDPLTLSHESTPSNPGAGTVKVYPKSDNKMYVLDSSGSESELGSGAGGAGAHHNFAQLNGTNWDAETGDETDWSVLWNGTPGTLDAVASGTTAPKLGTYSMSIDFAESGDVVVFDMGDPLMVGENTNCIASFYYKGFDGNVTVDIYDADNAAVKNTTTLTAKSDWFRNEDLSFICESGVEYHLRFSATGDAAVGYVDNVWGGENYLVGQTSTASYIGSATWAGVANCIWTRASDQSFANFAADSDCNDPTLTGDLTDPGSKIPGFDLTGGPGRYVVKWFGNFRDEATAAGTCQWQANSVAMGTSFAGGQYGAASDQHVPYLETSFETTSSLNNDLITLQATGGAASNTCAIYNAYTIGQLRAEVYFYPTSSQTGVAMNDIAISWSGYQNIGTSWTTTSTSYADFTASGSATLTERTNTGAGSVTTAASNLPGVIFDFKKAGPWTICATVPPTLTAGAATSSVRITDGTDVVAELNTQSSGRNSVQFCGLYVVESPGSQTIKLQGKAGTSTTLRLADSTTAASGVIEWIIAQGAFSQNAALVVGGVTSTYQGVTRTEYAELNCDSGSAITRQHGSWVSTIGNVSSGACEITFVSGTFSDSPYCFAQRSNSTASTGGLVFSIEAISSSAVTVDCSTTGGACTAVDFNLECTGPR